jgi:hypothetical protein
MMKKHLAPIRSQDEESRGLKVLKPRWNLISLSKIDPNREKRLSYELANPLVLEGAGFHLAAPRTRF